MYHVEGVNFNEMTEKMEKALQLLYDSLLGIRSGAVTPGYVDTFRVPYYGQQVPIKHVASTSSERNLVVIRPHDPALMGSIQTALKDAGFNAYIFSKTTVAVSVPPLNGQDRERVKTQIRKLGEEAKVSIRNIRRTARAGIDKALPEDERKVIEAQIQRATDEAVARADETVRLKLEWLG